MNVDAVSALLREASQTHVLPRYQRLDEADISTKSGPEDLVTAADLACEAFLTERLADLLPGSRVVGEEAVAVDDTRLDWLEREGDVWIIDPVDGTHNFAHGRGDFAIIVALVRDGELAAGWIHVPLSDKTVAAERGQGCWSAGARLRVAAPGPIDQMHAVLYVGPKKYPALYDRIRATREQQGPRSYSRSAGMEYVHLVEGQVHYAMFTRQLPWDHAAGWLIHREAGGHGAYLDGSAYVPLPQAKPFLLAPDAQSWEQIRAFYAD